MKYAARYPFVLSLLVLLFLIVPGARTWAQACPDDDLDGYADCTVAGCDTTGLLCGDCDDGNLDVNPSETEVCNHTDDDCDGLVDEGFSQPTTRRYIRDVADGVPGDQFGRSIAAVGDLDGDGAMEFVVGVMLDSNSIGANAGSVRLYNGADLSLICEGIDPGGAGNDYLGVSVAAIGDVTGDGTPDFVAGAYLDTTGQGQNSGSASVFSGADCSYVRKLIDTSGSNYDYLGYSVAGIGDITGDSVPDIAAGAYLDDTAGGTDAGSVTLFSGSDGTVIRKLTNPAGGGSDYLGYSVAGIGDITGDSVPDIAAGSTGDDDTASAAGSVVVFSGSDGSVIWTLTDPAGNNSDNLGHSVAGIGDVNGDSTNDIVAGAINDDTTATNSGAVVVFSGADGSLIRLLTDPTSAAYDNLGYSVAVMPDLTGDGIEEVITGVYGYDDGGTADVGSVVILNPVTNVVVDRLTDPAGRATDRLGLAVAAVTDLSGDGGPEILAGAPLAESVEETDVGKVVIFSFEADCDGDGVSPFGNDCDDTDGDNYSGNTEICDAQDNDCDGSVDEDDDGDGADKCADCDDANPRAYPGATEVCNGIDDDCDTFVDNGPDNDADTFEAPCDCDDGNFDVNPGATEVCNYLDENCGRVDEGFQVVAARDVSNISDGAPNDEFGHSVAAVGDVNGDGAMEFVVGVRYDDNAQGTNAGSVRLYNGADLSLLCEGFDPGGASSDYLGSSVAGIGDVTGDGIPDIAAGAYNDTTGQASAAGSVSIFSGADCSYVRKLQDFGAENYDYLGFSVAGMPDITGDGVPEILAGAYVDDTARGTDTGSVLVFNGDTGDLEFKSFDPQGRGSDWLGYSVAAVGDVDYDGVPDYAGGMYGDDNLLGSAVGAVAVFSGADGSLIRKMTTGSANDYLGYSLAGIGDVDGDGVDDILAGVPNEDFSATNGGAVAVFSGADGSLIRLLTDPTSANYDNLGWSVTTMPDITGDGIQEVVAGAYLDDVNLVTDAGSVVIFDPTNGTVVDRLTDPDGAATDKLGTSVAAVADLSGDGAPEIIAGVPLDESIEETAVGKVVIFSFEADCDGDGVSPFGNDCDDTDGDNYSGNTEICDAQDNDCDGAVDEDDDGDGADKCADCDDANPRAYPGATETCNGIDDDCDTFVDNGPDNDADTFEAPCDCDDGNFDVNPGATEVCNYLDENCGQVDEGFQVVAARDVSNIADGAPNDEFGHSVAAVGDVNGDGAVEFVVGVRYDDNAQGTNAGSVRLYNGADLSLICEGIDPGGASSDYLGSSVAGIGDVTGDGIPDIAAGAYNDTTGQASAAGSVSIFSGADCSYVRKLQDFGAENYDYLGFSVAGMPDITGDGVPEILAGAYVDDTARGTDTGSVLVFNGDTGDLEFKSFDPQGRGSDWLGYSVAAVGDVDYDGVPDYAGGMYGNDNLLGNATGAVAVFSGADGSLIRKMTTGSANDYLGYSLAGIGDVDGDGVDDILAGVPNEDFSANNAGGVVLFSGADGSVIRLLTDFQGSSHDYLGWSVAVMPDITGDGIQEVVAGAYMDDVDLVTDAGSVVVFDPTNGTVLHRLSDPDLAATDKLGTSVAAVADLSGDGAPEIIAGIPLDESVEETDVGKVVIFSFEADCDGDGVSPFGVDCDDTDGDNYSGNTEICDAQDNDCDGLVDEDDDGDGADKCADCDDDNPRVHPGAVETCNGVDDDCDLSVDNGPDNDADTFEAPCDCDDNDADINPGGTEVCNRQDDDCDGEIDESFTGAMVEIKIDDPAGVAYDYYGQSVAGVGDVDGDGAVDFAVGVVFDDNTQGNNAGSVLVYSGHDRSEICRLIDPGGSGNDYLGFSVAGIGDVTGDGVPDIAAGAYSDTTGQATAAGSVSIFSGADCSYVRRLIDLDAENYDYLGYSIAAMPDITGDGVPEVLAGAYTDDTPRGTDAGSLLVFNGATGALVFKSNDPQGRASDWLGFSVAAVGDMNFDGIPDYAGGMYGDDNLLGNAVGAVAVFSGADGSLIRKMTSGSSSDYLGYSIAGIGDVDGDGVDDILAGVLNEDFSATNAGGVVLFSGADGSAIRLLTDFTGEAYDNLGYSVAAIPDLTGDGIQEVLAGANDDDTPAGANAGSMTILDPTNGNVVLRLTDADGAASDEFGTWVATIGDIRNGGVDELLGSAVLDDNALGIDTGSAVLYSFDEYDCDADTLTPLTGDCDDTDPNTPGPEICDGIDNDCDGVVPADEANADGDAFRICEGDCDDTDDTVFPGGVEIPDDGIDQDCSGTDTVTCFVDSDGDTYGSIVTVLAADGDCTDPGESGVDTDCDDTNDAIFPGAAETPDDGIDQDCNGADTITCFVDGDQDGFGSTATTLADDASCDTAQSESSNSTDCDDTSDTIYPGATEIADDGIDQDCNGADTVTCFVDADQDGYGTDVGTTVAADDGTCDTGQSESVNNLDCNDGDVAINPGATEIPGDGIDQDCDGSDAATCFVDNDGDTYGSTDTIQSGDGDCTDPGESDVDTDCDDTDITINPGAAEVPDDGIDQDCNGADSITCFVDADQDGFGSTATTLADDGTCDTGQSESDVDTDCDDTSGTVYPGAAETPDDGIDQDCSGADTITCFVDGDQDGFGSTTTTLADDGTCDTGQSESDVDTDCDDADDTIYPGAAETPDDGIDQDCNGSDTVTCFEDVDQDGFGSTTTTLADDGTCDTGQSESDVDTDCDDADDTAFPGAAEVPDDGIDQDCSGADTITCFVDGDQDGFGSTATVLADDGTCDTGQSESDVDTDCDDTDNTIFPGAAEVSDDGVDQDCNGADTITCFVDGDQDGFGSTTTTLAGDGTCDTGQSESDVSTDCDDTSNTVYPGAAETPDDGIDQDCNGDDTITCFVDGDQDGYGTDAGTTVLADDGSCDTGQSESVNDQDCDDTDAAIRPGAIEIPGDGIDQNCDGSDAATCFVDNDLDTYGSTDTIQSMDGDCTDPGESDNSLDCDDTDIAINPGAAEVPDDGIDQDCTGSDTITCFVDGDQDGFGSAATVLADDGTCDTGQSESDVDTDCDDTDNTIYPGAVETADDGIDQDCNGSDTVTCFVDGDQDGFGRTATTLADDGTCDKGQSESDVDTDCDDTDNTIYPGATEVPGDGIDQDCNGSDTATCFEDGDQDGFGSTTTVLADDGTCDTGQSESDVDTDCDDADDTAFPGAAEVPDDGIDQDCSGADTITCFVDGDQDGFGSTATVLADDGTCDTGQSESDVDTDCDDTENTIYPGATEVADDGIDQDCNGNDTVTCFVDGDQDGFGSTTTTPAGDGTCDTGQSESDVSTDCDDTSNTVYPGAAETPDDGIDQDCSGADTITCYVDADQDGYGTDAGTTVLADDGTCDTGQSESDVDTDCDDDDAAIHPGATEIPGDGIDQNCDGSDAATCFVDSDGDTYGSTDTIQSGDGDCTDPGESENSTDCDDTDNTIFPGAAETPDDGVDQDCDGVDSITCFVDGDQDGFGGTATTVADDGTCDTGQSESDVDTDCDDTDNTIYPGAAEIAEDGIDQDCNGVDTITCFVDGDQDGFGGTATTPADDGTCDTGQSESDVDTDCDDTSGTVYPGAAEVADDGIDQDCNGADTVTCYVDADQDGFGSTMTVLADDGVCNIGQSESTNTADCNDAVAAINPAAEEVCDSVDNNCDGRVDEGFDNDDDGFTSCGGDCDDNNDAINPGEAEICDDEVDNDCDGNADLQDLDCAVAITMCSILGDEPPPSKRDQDVFTVNCVEDEELTVVLETSGNARPGRVSLLLVDALDNVSYQQADLSALPNRITATVPAAGEYRIAVMEQTASIFLPGRRFIGDYCLTVDSSAGAVQTLQATESVETVTQAMGVDPPRDPAEEAPAVRTRKDTRSGSNSAPGRRRSR